MPLRKLVNINFHVHNTSF